MSKMMTIGEFARRTGLSVSAIRFYDGRGLLAPADVDASSGYRRYADHQVDDGALIRDLRRLDMSLAEIARALGLSMPDRERLVVEHLEALEMIVDRAHLIARTMGVHPRQEQPDMPSTTLQTLDLDQALEQVLSAAGTSAEAPHFMGVLVEAKEGSLRFVATDSHRLAIRDVVPSALTEEFSAVVPAAALAQWRSSLTNSGELEIVVSERDMTVTGDEVDLHCLVMPVTFPDYEGFLDAAPEAASIVVDRSALLDAVQTLDDRTAVLDVGGSRLRLTQGRREVDVEAAVDGPLHRVGINPVYVNEAIRHAVGRELVIEIVDPLTPVLFRSADDGTYVSLVMPIELDDTEANADGGD